MIELTFRDLLPALRPVLVEFDRLGILNDVGRSVASSLYGEPRSTLDVDIGAELPESAVRELIRKWECDFYVNESAMRDAVLRSRCFTPDPLQHNVKGGYFRPRN
jgi:hypothetical protein